jgi:predicted O-methyltransferase YrrM
MKRFRLFYKFIIHFISARNTRGFGVHSPFIFQFTKYVLIGEGIYYVFPKIESIRINLKKNKSKIKVQDFGTGNDRTRKISDIAKYSLKGKKYGQLFYRIINYYNLRYVLELGTSLGITTSYLASSSKYISCISLEGCPEISRIAIENFKKLNLENIKIVTGNIDNTFSEVLNETERLDFVFIDANHRYESIIHYFEECLKKVHSDTIMIIDDIYWSSEMEKAWETIRKHPKVTSTIDLFQIGIVFFNSDLHKKHYKMRY